MSTTLADLKDIPPRITSMRFFSGRVRREPKIGDRRVTKKHGLQIRVVSTHNGMWMRSGSRYLFDWQTPQELMGTSWEYLLHRIIPKT